MKLKLKEHTLFDVLNELTNLYGHGVKTLCVICNDKKSLDGDEEPYVDGENVTKIECRLKERDKKIVPVLDFEFDPDKKPMKLVDIIRYLERLPIPHSSKVALRPDGAGLKYKYDCKVLEDDDIWNVTVE